MADRVTFTSGIFYSMGGIMMNVGGILESILGNTFPCAVFMSFGTFLIGLAITLTPAHNASTAFDPSNPMNPGFENSFSPFLGNSPLIRKIRYTMSSKSQLRPVQCGK
ncbi:hypothetical protein NEUTE1DRAFT_135114 [Neurospora tetrasperma FGSC 2508]|uniref:Uncharacterized protein n=1 Tax=Neurospora tetrasperma (strain FGSC 2508 / ATCC MYA-4615 / P0657) TaxID=510951 RepID=F8MBM5_NEUT8|nr:uncharacterized protein NEUTE1DRAFT_135114 [Neurospora tetrasperma FGSC 2508]EGO61137.1 hypothetical protein NEUTE1DRAFT_135114 [Neurospora tetrasperma FGSC 2508]